jgi:hypothetical protein
VERGEWKEDMENQQVDMAKWPIRMARPFVSFSKIQFQLPWTWMHLFLL